MGERIKVGPDGFIELVEHMGSDASICESARVSYDQTGKQGDDRKLIRYLMRHNHTSPFEMAELRFIVRVPIDIWRQWVRHRTASINEHSTRYREAIEAVAFPDWKDWRTQSTTNKQGSGDLLPPDVGVECTFDFVNAADACNSAYKSLLRRGVAREQARSVLQLANYTEAYWKINLHNLIHFLRLRMAPDAQQEIREYANAIHDLINPLFPLTMQAFRHYRLGAMQLTRLDIQAIRFRDWTGETIEDARERGEYLQKLKRLKLGEVCNEIHE
jgi:thymidylate synthase (FAD)